MLYSQNYKITKRNPNFFPNRGARALILDPPLELKVKQNIRLDSSLWMHGRKCLLSVYLHILFRGINVQCNKIFYVEVEVIIVSGILNLKITRQKLE